MSYICKVKCYWGERLWEVGKEYKGEDTPPMEWFEKKPVKKVEPKPAEPVAPEAPVEENTELAPEDENNPVKVATRKGRKPKA